MNPNDTDKIEAAVSGLLRGLPARRAPRSLESRVMAEIARRASLPWWRKSYSHWPAAAKAGFVATCALAATLVVVTLMAAGRTEAVHSVAGGFTSLRALLSLGREITAAAALRITSAVDSIPSLVLYGAIAAVASSYAALAAIGAAAYRLGGASRKDN